MELQGFSAAGLSRKAGLNPRAVTDILDGRIDSPRVQTVIALEHALDTPAGTLLGLDRSMIMDELFELLSGLDKATQQRLLDTLQSLQKT